MPGRSVKFRTGYKKGEVAGKGSATTTKKKEPGIIRRTLSKIRKKFFQLSANNMKLLQKQAKKNLHQFELRKKAEACLANQKENFTMLQRRKQT